MLSGKYAQPKIYSIDNELDIKIHPTFRILVKTKAGVRPALILTIKNSADCTTLELFTQILYENPEEDIIRRYYKSFVKFWDEYRLQVDDWTLFYNGYDYAPVVVSFGKKEKYDIINKEKQELFYNIYKIAKDEIKVND